ncbi:MAG: response regulator, partial [Oxalobacteraceae bacterium]
MIDGTILVVDDNEINRVVAGAMVSSLGAFAAYANDGEEALTHCRAAPPRLVLMDVQMPQMNG